MTTVTMTELDKQTFYAQAVPFLRAVADSPGDPLHRMIFADWLDEHGLSREAAGQRWAAREGKFPRSARHSPCAGGWYGIIGGDGEEPWMESTLPDVLWDTDLEGFRVSHGRDAEGLFQAELTFLKACGRVNWDDGGNPA